jgi:NAD(P)-dependent dehydrogenase (short-subunit alcohol dehydrogenase family)
MSKASVVLVTGVSSGIGEVTARTLVREGWRVFGTVRSPTSEVPPDVERVVMDVRDDASVEAGVASVLARAGRIDGLVNNAGTTVSGAIEETDTAQAQALFDVNFFGVVRVTRAVLPAMRERRAGRIIIVSSVLGFLPAPFMGFYAASKHALEGYSESLDHEVRTMGVRAVLIEPAFMKTKLGKNAGRAARAIGDYGAAAQRVSASVEEHLARGGEPSIVAAAVASALRAPNPRLRYPVGKGSGLLAFMRSVAPEGLFDRTLRREFDLD